MNPIMIVGAALAPLLAVPPSVVVFAGGVIVTLIGVIYRMMKSRLDDIENAVEQNADDIRAIEQSLYGNEDDPFDGGYAEVLESETED